MGVRDFAMSDSAKALDIEIRTQLKKTLDGVSRDFAGWCSTEIRKLGLEPDVQDASADKGSKKRKEKDPNKPKREPTAYNVWVKMCQDDWTKKHPDGEKPPGGIMKHASESWPKSYMNKSSENYSEDRTKTIVAKYAQGQEAPALEPSPAKKKKKSEAEEAPQEEVNEAPQEEQEVFEPYSCKDLFRSFVSFEQFLWQSFS